jgi:hypothetical protein
MAELLDLSGLALELAHRNFEEQVKTLIEAAGGDASDLALAAARLSTDGPAQGGSLDHIAFALLLEAAHRAVADGAQRQKLSTLAS